MPVVARVWNGAPFEGPYSELAASLAESLVHIAVESNPPCLSVLC